MKLTSSKEKNNLLIAIYFHPEAYPPTLNAVGELSDCFTSISILHRPHLKGTWNYPSNVTAIPSGNYISSVEQELSPIKKKVSFFFSLSGYFSYLQKEKPAVILVYDSLSLLAYSLVKPFLHKHRIWYHNHDVNEISTIRKYSISWFAAKEEVKAFKYLDIFSLPTDDRLKYFPLKEFRGQYFFIPNYPAKRFYGSFYQVKRLSQPLKIIFQGAVGPYHGIEEIIPLLNETINGYNLELVLKGPCLQAYRETVTELADKHGVRHKLFFIGITPYAEVPQAGAACHIGLGILAKQDIMNTTLGTASNKLYEYAALGLPVLYYNSPDFTNYLGSYAWAVPTELDSDSIREKIGLILASYEALSGKAHLDFDGNLNFETGFKKTKHYINALLVKTS